MDFKPETYVETILAERREREAGLRTDEHSWLALAGLFGLVEGENHFGSDPANEIALPVGKAPPRAGVFHFHNGQTRLEVAEGVTITHEGAAIRSLEMESDEVEEPDIIHLGSLSMLVIQRGENCYIRLYDQDSATRQGFSGLVYYPVNPAWRVEADFAPYEPPKPVTILDVAGNASEDFCVGYVTFRLRGQECRLDIDEADDDGLFFNFCDETNQDATYQGGRFLTAELPQNGKVVLDFNQAYNPPCVYTPYATCPIPLPQNKLPLRVEAGEMRLKV